MNEDYILIAFGKKVRHFRDKKGLTQEQLAFEVGIDSTHMGGIERGTRNPTLLVMGKIAAALSVPLVALLSDDEGAMLQ